MVLGVLGVGCLGVWGFRGLRGFDILGVWGFRGSVV